MKMTMTLIAACVGVALVGQAAAMPNENGKNGWTFAPANEAFTGTGTIVFTITGQPTVNCNVSVSGETRTAGSLKINSLTFSDNGDGTCSDVSSSTAEEQSWNPTARAYAHWIRANFILSPKGIHCRGNIGFGVNQADGSDTVITLKKAVPSEAGVCHVNGSIDIGNVVIIKTPSQ